ncbi:BZ3500_MvSof-1268-A1-R1_Chr11-1g03258 [Microbotryum saponariae]|uniref:BZ3500_MvSof-1268-A1-R1_Chr11-1g03258 protein n=1 Tax=Microbotryum saponariae TaxID=289078 RepID=A0A2X0LAC9_9BASI|nr:BZ3501_MvSof-1269-A2-R1_Chr11g02833 [Microbotryum saponariae]SDA03824.1 BZ3500_MvSof-1268-A1-R1_Chr11-1g03258 [Microbotryum saponariae]
MTLIVIPSDVACQLSAGPGRTRDTFAPRAGSHTCVQNLANARSAGPPNHLPYIEHLIEDHPTAPPTRVGTPTLACGDPATSSAPNTVKDCIFCGVTKSNSAFKVVYEDNEFVVFRDRSPGSKVHLLAIPKSHVDNVKMLLREDLDFVERIKAVGHVALQQAGVAPHQRRLGFHIPPFFSVNHLHLHLLSTPLPFPGSFKYRPAIPKTKTAHAAQLGTHLIKVKGLSWFVEVDQVLRILAAGERVKVGAVKIRLAAQGTTYGAQSNQEGPS